MPAALSWADPASTTTPMVSPNTSIASPRLRPATPSCWRPGRDHRLGQRPLLIHMPRSRSVWRSVPRTNDQEPRTIGLNLRSRPHTTPIHMEGLRSISRFPLPASTNGGRPVRSVPVLFEGEQDASGTTGTRAAACSAASSSLRVQPHARRGSDRGGKGRPERGHRPGGRNRDRRTRPGAVPSSARRRFGASRTRGLRPCVPRRTAGGGRGHVRHRRIRTPRPAACHKRRGGRPGRRLHIVARRTRPWQQMAQGRRRDHREHTAGKRSPGPCPRTGRRHAPQRATHHARRGA